MQRCNFYIEKELAEQKQKRKEYQALLKHLPEGKLVAANIKNNLYYTKMIDGQRFYLGRDTDKEVQDLQQRMILEAALKRIDKNIPLMESFLRKYQSPGLEEILSGLPKAYRSIDISKLTSADFLNARRWEMANYLRSNSHPEHLKHRTQKGDMVRSKSEVIIANILTAEGIPYHYEEVMEVNGVRIAPDFKVAVMSENRFKYLEHCGMISDPGYRDSFLWKLNHYIESGLVPWRDVFFTFDDMDGSIDTQTIYDIVHNYLK